MRSNADTSGWTRRCGVNEKNDGRLTVSWTAGGWSVVLEPYFVSVTVNQTGIDLPPTVGTTLGSSNTPQPTGGRESIR